jgi:hypothetical protein
MVEINPELLREVANPWLLGADPEFAVLEPPDKLVANQGTYATEVDSPDGGIGNDHSGRVWEIRPQPSTSAYGVVTNIWKLLRHSQLAKVERFKWKGGALGARKTPEVVAPNADPNFMNPAPATTHDTLGGHVHFGIAGFNGPQRAALDALTTALLNLDVLPMKENTKRLATSHYGRFNHDAVRSCNGHIEYRCAPSWLDKPGQALAVLTSYKLAATKPSVLNWTGGFEIKCSFLEWLANFAQTDVDAFLLDRFITRRGFDAVCADPDSNFRPRWRKEELWAK